MHSAQHCWPWAPSTVGKTANPPTACRRTPGSQAVRCSVAPRASEPPVGDDRRLCLRIVLPCEMGAPANVLLAPGQARVKELGVRRRNGGITRAAGMTYG